MAGLTNIAGGQQKLLAAPKSQEFYFYENWLKIISGWKRLEDAEKEGHRLLTAISQSHANGKLKNNEAVELINGVRTWANELRARHARGEFNYSSEPAINRRAALPQPKHDTPRGYIVQKALRVAEAKAAKLHEQMTLDDFRDWFVALNILERSEDRTQFIEFFLKVKDGVDSGRIPLSEAKKLEELLTEKDTKLERYAQSETARLARKIRETQGEERRAEGQ
jgi:hypothetical protein